MANVSDAALNAAERRGEAMLNSVPRARVARYETETGRVVLELMNGCTYSFPTALVQGLRDVAPDDLAEVEIDGVGFNLQFPSIDVDLYIPSLLSGIFGTRAWMTRELARIAGSATSPAKSAAARANGAKGGRPRKAAHV